MVRYTINRKQVNDICYTLIHHTITTVMDMCVCVCVCYKKQDCSASWAGQPVSQQIMICDVCFRCLPDLKNYINILWTKITINTKISVHGSLMHFMMVFRDYCHQTYIFCTYKFICQVSHMELKTNERIFGRNAWEDISVIARFKFSLTVAVNIMCCCLFINWESYWPQLILGEIVTVNKTVKFHIKYHVLCNRTFFKLIIYMYIKQLECNYTFSCWSCIVLLTINIQV